MTLNISDNDGDSSGTYYFYFENDSGEWQEITDGGTSDDGNFTTATWDTASSAGDLDGDYEVNVTNGTAGYVVTQTVTVDNEDPSADSYSPNDEALINNAGPDVSYNADGTGSNVVDTQIEVEEDSSGDIVESDDSSSVSTSGLDSGETYEVNIDIQDEAGNTYNNSNEWEFTVDTSYDIADPSLSWESNVTDGVVRMDDDETLSVEFDDDDEQPNEVICMDDGDTIDTVTDVPDVGDNYVAECEIDEGDYGGETIDLEIEASDEAGNSDTYSEGEYTFDTDQPTVENMSTTLSNVKSSFEVEYDASDDSGIESLEYFYDDDSVDEGDGTEVDSPGGTFDAAVSDLDSGDHELYMRVKDTAGRWSEIDTSEDYMPLEFSYLPGASREVTIDAPQRVEATAGSSSSFSVTVENTGKLLIEEADVSVSGPGADGTETVADMEPGDSVNVSFQVSPGSSDIGEKELTVSALNGSVNIPFRVKASQNQRQSIDSKISDYQSRLNDLEGSVQNLRDKGLNSDLESRLNENFTEFKNTIEEASRQTEAGEYYKAQSTLSNIDQQYSNAQASYVNVKEERETLQRNRIIMGSVALLLLIGVGGGGFYLYRGDREFDELIDQLNLDVLKQKVQEITNSEPDADDFEWDGFN